MGFYHEGQLHTAGKILWRHLNGAGAEWSKISQTVPDAAEVYGYQVCGSSESSRTHPDESGEAEELGFQVCRNSDTRGVPPA